MKNMKRNSMKDFVMNESKKELKGSEEDIKKRVEVDLRKEKKDKKEKRQRKKQRDIKERGGRICVEKDFSPIEQNRNCAVDFASLANYNLHPVLHTSSS
jgi:hypothetical protein